MSGRRPPVALDEPLQFFFAAVRAVVPGLAVLKDVEAGAIEFSTGSELWEWVVRTNPVAAALVSELTDEQRSVVCEILTGMLRERSGGSSPAVVTAPRGKAAD